MIVASAQVRIVAIDPTSKGFGYVVVESGPPLLIIDWGVAHIRSRKNAQALERIAELLGWYNPNAVVLEDWEAPGSRRRPRVRALLAAVAIFAERSGLPAERVPRRAVRQVFLQAGARTKGEIAALIAEWLPELAPRLPRPRRIWMSEDERIRIFDATALALAYFAQAAHDAR